MSNFVWNDFGVLTSVSKDEKFVWVSSAEGHELKMSIVSYEDIVDSVYQKAQSLVGKPVKVRTSQNTSNWNKIVWFSEIRPVEKYRAAETLVN